jgi:hypothetical protein
MFVEIFSHPDEGVHIERVWELGHEEIELHIFEENYLMRCFMIFNLNVTEVKRLTGPSSVTSL